jgi:hypothetical protein
MFSFSNMFHFFAHELSRLSRRKQFSINSCVREHEGPKFIV